MQPKKLTPEELEIGKKKLLYQYKMGEYKRNELLVRQNNPLSKIAYKSMLRIKLELEELYEEINKEELENEYAVYRNEGGSTNYYQWVSDKFERLFYVSEQQTIQEQIEIENKLSDM